MTEAEILVDRICDRLRLHWPAAACGGEIDAQGYLIVRMRVVDALWLELRSPSPPQGIMVPPWTVGPIEADATGAWRTVSRAYGIGHRAAASAEDVADRFYEEVRFWWAEYARIALTPRLAIPAEEH